MVTFKKTDPLYVFDCPTRTREDAGRAEDPWFSVYMHLMDATHLLTIGYDAADQGDFAYFTGVILQTSTSRTPPLRSSRTRRRSVRAARAPRRSPTTRLQLLAPKNLLAIR